MSRVNGPSQPEADARCIAEVLAGNRQRFSELIERYQDAVMLIARAYARDSHTAEDVAQEVFIQAFTALASLRDPTLFFPWLQQIARHRAARANDLNDKRPDRYPLTDQTAPVTEEQTTHERVVHVWSQVEQLPEPYRRTVLLKYKCNLSCKEIAEREGVAISTITSRLTRGLIILRNVLR
ncbi:MAG: sigma-70 family RNA polymerase sigma factor [Planctomycetota bacterium]